MTTRHHRLVDPLIALAVGLAAFALYLRTLAPGLLWGDSAEFQLAAWLGGFTHPTGYPLYLMLGWAWTHLLPLSDPAWRMNLFSAVWGGVAVGLVYLAAVRILHWVRPGIEASAGFSGPRNQPADPKGGLRTASTLEDDPGGKIIPGSTADRLLALAAALVFAVTPTFWSQAVVAEVYTLHAAFVAAILLAALAWADQPGWPRLYLLAGLVGFSLAHHRTTLLLLPGLAVFVLAWSRGFSRLDGRCERPANPKGGLRTASIPASREAVVKMIRRLLTAAALLLAPLLLYAYIPLIAPRTPYFTVVLGSEQTLALYEPTLRGFLAHISGSVFRSALGAARGPWLAELAGRLAGELTWPGVALGLVGIGWLAWRDRRVLALTGLSFLAFVLFNAFYAIGDIHVFYIPVYLVWILWLAAGAGAAGQRLTIWTRGFSRLLSPSAKPPEGSIPSNRHVPGSGVETSASSVEPPKGAERSSRQGRVPFDFAQDMPRRHSAIAAFRAGCSPVSRAAIVIMPPLLLALAGWLLAANFARADRSADRTARAAWETVLAQSIPQDAILVSNDRDEMVPQWYLRYVEGRRPDLTGLFPLIQPGPAWLDVAAVTEQALRTGRPVYLVKPMPGLEVKFALEPLNPAAGEARFGTLLRVLGPAAEGNLPRCGGAVFGERVRLAGYDVQPAAISAGQPLEIVLDWEPLAPLEHDYTTFVHVVNAEGKVIGQSDQSPGGVYYPTNLWRPGEKLRDRHRLVIAQDLGPAPYALEVGLYRLAPDLQHLGSPQRVGEIGSVG